MSLLNYYINSETTIKESINSYSNIFNEYIYKTPTLREALMQMFKSSGANLLKSNNLTREILTSITRHLDMKFKEIRKKYPLITLEEAQTISCYTCELSDKSYSPYKILNINLVSKERNNGISNISKYLFIFLKALRKLDKFYPNKGQHLYRSINSDIDSKSYYIGNTKVFWSFTSTSQNASKTYNFLGDKIVFKYGTIFTLTGNIWGYDIKLFNVFNEDEVLLEPERKIKIIDILPKINNITHVTCKVLDTPIVLEKIFKNENQKKVYLF